MNLILYYSNYFSNFIKEKKDMEVLSSHNKIFSISDNWSHLASWSIAISGNKTWQILHNQRLTSKFIHCKNICFTCRTLHAKLKTIIDYHWEHWCNEKAKVFKNLRSFSIFSKNLLNAKRLPLGKKLTSILKKVSRQREHIYHQSPTVFSVRFNKWEILYSYKGVTFSHRYSETFH